MAQQESYWKNKLLEMQTELLHLEEKNKEGLEAVELDQSRIGRLSRMDALQAQAMNNAIAARRKQALSRIDAAFNRLADGDFGYCMKCGDEIAEKRLSLDPTTLYCTDC